MARRTRDPVVVFSGGGTGGHLYPALNLAEALTALRPDVHPHFIGAERGIEARILPERRVEHTLLPIQGIPRDGNVIERLAVLPALAGSLVRVSGQLLSMKPDLVVVTGGYAGAPAGMAARGLRIPLALQEQNAYPGMTTRMLAEGARQIHVGYPEAVERLPWDARANAHVSGNPVRPPAPVDRNEACRAFDLDPSRPVLLVVGGSQGSQALNAAVLDWLAALPDTSARPGGVQLLWSTGAQHLDAVRGSLRAGEPVEGIHVTGYLDDMAAALSCADLAVSRAGAMATSEFLAWGVPAILVPLPSAAADHQTSNALALQEAGAALHLAQAGLTGTGLGDAVATLATDPPRREAMAAAARERGRPGAAHGIAVHLAELLPPAPRATGSAEGRA